MSPPSGADRAELRIAVIGAGPYGLSVLERLHANAVALVPDLRVTVHLIDPYLSVGGRIWRDDQPDRLWMNTTVGAVSLFPDESVTCAGPINRGPSLHEWALRSGRTLSTDEALGNSAEPDSSRRWASRALAGAYMKWFLDELDARSGQAFAIVRHPVAAIDVTRTGGPGPGDGHGSGPGHGSELVWLDGLADPLECDCVVLAAGTAEARPTRDQQRMAALAERAGGCYLGPGLATRESVEHIKPGENLVLRGLGLTFFDYLQLLTVGRGGAFRRADNGALVYEPSGREPAIYACSPRGVPYSPAPWPALMRPRFCALPRFFVDDSIASAVRDHDDDGAFRHVTRLIMADVENAYYTELFDSHEGRTTMPWAEFSARFGACALDRGERDRLVAQAVPDLADRLDLEAFEAPMQTCRCQSPDELQQWMRDHLARLANRSLGRDHTAHRAALTSLTRALSRLNQARRQDAVRRHHHAPVVLLSRLRLWASTRVRWMEGGPPWPRFEELIALSRAGVVWFLGPDSALHEDEGERGDSDAISCSGRLAPQGLKVTSVIDARNAEASFSNSANALFQNLWARGEISEATVDLTQGSAPRSYSALRVNGDRNLVAADEEVWTHRYAIGATTSHPLTLFGFPRTRMNSDVFRATDDTARSVLTREGAAHDAHEADEANEANKTDEACVRA